MFRKYEIFFSFSGGRRRGGEEKKRGEKDGSEIYMNEGMNEGMNEEMVLLCFDSSWLEPCVFLPSFFFLFLSPPFPLLLLFSLGV